MKKMPVYRGPHGKFITVEMDPRVIDQTRKKLERGEKMLNYEMPIPFIDPLLLAAASRSSSPPFEDEDEMMKREMRREIIKELENKHQTSLKCAREAAHRTGYNVGHNTAMLKVREEIALRTGHFIEYRNRGRCDGSNIEHTKISTAIRILRELKEKLL